jgi:hypothetical protein
VLNNMHLEEVPRNVNICIVPVLSTLFEKYICMETCLLCNLRM